MKIKVVLEPSDEGGYTVYAPSLPGRISEGDTKEEALANIIEAMSFTWSRLKTISPCLRIPKSWKLQYD